MAQLRRTPVKGMVTLYSQPYQRMCSSQSVVITTDLACMSRGITSWPRAAFETTQGKVANAWCQAACILISSEAHHAGRRRHAGPKAWRRHARPEAHRRREPARRRGARPRRQEPSWWHPAGRHPHRWAARAWGAPAGGSALRRSPPDRRRRPAHWRTHDRRGRHLRPRQHLARCRAADAARGPRQALRMRGALVSVAVSGRLCVMCMAW